MSGFQSISDWLNRIAGTEAPQVDTELPAIAALADATANPTIPLLASSPLVFNGVTWDRFRSNHEVTVLASAARTDAINSPDLVNYNACGVALTIDITSITATPLLTVTIKYKDTLSGKYVSLLASAVLNAVSTTSLIVYPGNAAVANVKADSPLPRIWRVEVTVGDADSATYSISANYIN